MKADRVIGCVKCACPCALVGDDVPHDGLCASCRGSPLPAPRYACAKCGLGVVVVAEGADVVLIRACACAGAVVANASGKASGHGGFQRP